MKTYMVEQRRWMVALTVALTVASVAGCSVTGTADDAAVGSSIKVEDLMAAITDLYCETAVNCEGVNKKHTFSSLARCRAFVKVTDGVVDLDEPMRAFAKGTVDYDGVAAAACVAAAKGQCDFNHLPEVCGRIFVGSVALGGVCAVGYQCAGDAGCKHDKAGCDGSCVALAAEGEACGSVGCKPGLRCDLGTDQVVQCVADKPGAAGDDCVGVGGGVGVKCGPGLFCIFPDGGGALKCRAAGTEGMSCSSHTQCAANLACAHHKCAKRLATGAACDAVMDQRRCESGNICAMIGSPKDGNNKCLPIGTAGAACKSQLQCIADDLYCKGLETGAAEGACTSLPQVGEDCALFGSTFPSIYSCLTGYCDPASKKCTAPHGKGDACGPAGPCGAGLLCDQTSLICVEKVYHGCL